MKILSKQIDHSRIYKEILTTNMINGTSVFREKLVLIKLVLVMYLTFLSGTEESKESKEARRAQTCLVQLQELST